MHDGGRLGRRIMSYCNNLCLSKEVGVQHLTILPGRVPGLEPDEPLLLPRIIGALIPPDPGNERLPALMPGALQADGLVFRLYHGISPG
jgi:hypothetical protein